MRKKQRTRCKTEEPIGPFDRIFRELIRNALIYFLPMHPFHSETKRDKPKLLYLRRWSWIILGCRWLSLFSKAAAVPPNSSFIARHYAGKPKDTSTVWPNISWTCPPCYFPCNGEYCLITLQYPTRILQSNAAGFRKGFVWCNILIRPLFSNTGKGRVQIEYQFGYALWLHGASFGIYCTTKRGWGENMNVTSVYVCTGGVVEYCANAYLVIKCSFDTQRRRHRKSKTGVSSSQYIKGWYHSIKFKEESMNCKNHVQVGLISHKTFELFLFWI